MTTAPRVGLPGLDAPLTKYVGKYLGKYGGAFPSAVQEGQWQSNTITTRERAMLWFINTITDKPEWDRKVFDDTIVAKWRAELDTFVATGQEPLDRGFTNEMYDYCIKELRDKAKVHQETGLVAVFDAAGAVFKSDTAVSQTLRDALRKAAAPLEEGDKDWHPGSDDKVLDLVHPSLWPLVYGRTHVLKDKEINLDNCLDAYGSGDALPLPTNEPEQENKWGPPAVERLLSTKFQWLPAEVEFVDNKAKFTSYINNLHPKHQAEVYPVVEDLLTAAMPLFQATYDRVMSWTAVEDEMVRTRVPCMTSNRQCTTPMICNPKNKEGNYWCSSYNHTYIAHPERRRDDSPNPENDGEEDEDDDDDDNDNDDDDEDNDNDNDDGEDYLDALMEEIEQDRIANPTEAANTEATTTEGAAGGATENGVAVANDNDDDDEDDESDDDDNWEAQEAWFNETHPIKQPEPKEYEYLGVKEFNTAGPWFPEHKRLQVIVKLANIHLTPEKPTYDGGSWHIEGQLNERICATALYYYDNDNITESKLGFRTVADREEMTCNFEYDQGDHEPFKQIYGANVEMGDEDSAAQQHHGDVVTREGRLLVFPNVYQHRVSGFELADKTKPGHRKIVAIFLVDPNTPVISTANVPPQQIHWCGIAPVDNKLPPEIAEMVYSELPCPYNLDTAKKIREELIEERKTLDVKTDELVRYAEWSFCEH